VPWNDFSFCDPMKKILSASRRTDIPAFYLDWFLHCLTSGSFSLVNPFNGSLRRVTAGREEVGAIVFWSKNFGFLLERLKELSGWNLLFNFTLNSPDPVLEPHLPPMKDRLEQMRTLVTVFGPRAVRWRFDPVVFYRTADGESNNLRQFRRLLDFAARLGVDRCTVSFMDRYRKIELREKRIRGFNFVYPETARLAEVAASMADLAAERRIRLLTCCEAELVARGIENLEAGSCIDHGLIASLYDVQLSHKQDKGQRKSTGCLCHESIDIGSYREQPCRCGCLYCYANPVIGGEDESGQGNRPAQ